MAQHPAVKVIEQDAAVRRSGAIPQDDVAMAATADSVLWNLDRLDQRNKVLDNSYDPAGDGSNVDIYILDSGMRLTHEEFEGRAQDMGYDAVDDLTGSNKQGVDDCNGHGTHCAGIAAGKTYGVAKQANIYSSRVLGCDGAGAVSGIIKAIDKVIEQSKKRGRPAVLSQSLDVKDSVAQDQAVASAVDAGVVCVSAAGNQMADSCDYSPGRVRSAIAVGATSREDKMSLFTNTGECTTIMAPGEQIKSSWIGSDISAKTGPGGTSMATPHVAGAAAIMLSKNPNLTPQQVKERMIEQSTKDAIDIEFGDVQNTPNRLLYVPSKTGAGGEMADVINRLV